MEVVIVAFEANRDGLGGIHRAAHIEMQMRIRRATGGADLTDGVTAIDPLAFADKHPIHLEVLVDPDRAVLMPDIHEVGRFIVFAAGAGSIVFAGTVIKVRIPTALAGAATGILDDTPTTGKDHPAGLGGEVEGVTLLIGVGKFAVVALAHMPRSVLIRRSRPEERDAVIAVGNAADT